MPFTFSHPAIVLPLIKIKPKYISSSALIMGSMAPDFEYFINMELGRVHGHTLAGAFYYDLPVTFICLLIFHLMVRDTLIDHLPHPLQKKYMHLKGVNWLQYLRKRWFVVLYCSVIGIMSHLCWDSFTHAPGFFVELIPFLQTDVSFFGQSMKAYYLMQILSSVIGGLIILVVTAWYYPAWKNRAILKIKHWQKTLQYLLVVMLVCFTVMILRGIENLNEFVATAIAGALIGLMAATFILSRFWLTKN